MTGPIGTVSGLSSGIQWRDLIDQMMAADKTRLVGPVSAQQAALQAQASAWTAFQGVAARLRDASAALQDFTTFDALSATAAKSATSGRDLVSATATPGATPGSYAVQVLGLANAQKLGGSFVASASVALGVSGQFALNGAVIDVAAGDSLVAVRDKINSANSGTSPSGVSATIVSTAAGSRLALTSDSTGASGIEAVDGPAGVLQSLGFTDGTVSANIAASGATQTNRVSSNTVAIGSFLGVPVGIPMPAVSTIRVGGAVVTVDLANDSLASIAAKINAATSNANAASVTSETVGSKTWYRLVTDATVTTDASVNLADSARILSTLGFTQAGHSGVAQVVTSANTFVDGGTAGNATGAALLTALQSSGQSVGVTAGDTMNISGTRGDGTAFTATLAVGAATSMQDLLDAVNTAASGARVATASLAGGRISLTDGTAGDSQLSLKLTVTSSTGGTTSLGAFSTANGGTTGYSRQIAAGTDSSLLLDGQLITRSSNSVSDALAGVTINLLAAEANTSVNLTLARDTSAITTKVKNVVAAYNEVKSFVTKYTADKAPLAHNGALRVMSGSLTGGLLAGITGLTGSFTTASQVGLQHDKLGVLALDEAKFAGFLKTNYSEVKKLLTLTGTPSDSEVTFVSAGTKAKASSTPYAVAITQAATQASVTGSIWATYSTAGLPDTLTITDAATGKAGAITIADGDTIASTAQRLNSLFATRGMQLQASVTVDSRLQITGLGYGAAAGFTVGYTPGAGGDGTAALGVAAQQYAGLDVAGTINGAAGTGAGQFLTGAIGDTTEGIVLQYTGTTARAAGTLAFTLGVGGTLASLTAGFSDATTGSATLNATSATEQATRLTSRIADLQRRLDARKAQLTKQFLAMETAVTKAQSIGSALTSQLNALQAAKQ